MTKKEKEILVEMAKSYHEKYHEADGWTAYYEGKGQKKEAKKWEIRALKSLARWVVLNEFARATKNEINY